MILGGKSYKEIFEFLKFIGYSTACAKKIIQENSDGLEFKGERGFAGDNTRTGNPYKDTRDDPNNPDNYLVQHPQSGKWISKKKPADYDEKKAQGKKGGKKNNRKR